MTNRYGDSLYGEATLEECPAPTSPTDEAAARRMAEALASAITKVEPAEARLGVNGQEAGLRGEHDETGAK